MIQPPPRHQSATDGHDENVSGHFTTKIWSIWCFRRQPDQAGHWGKQAQSSQRFLQLNTRRRARARSVTVLNFTHEEARAGGVTGSPSTLPAVHPSLSQRHNCHWLTMQVTLHRAISWGAFSYIIPREVITLFTTYT